MSKLNIDQKTIKSLFGDKKSNFIIPDYQRPYAWGDKECQTLWDDLFAFSFPEDEEGNPDPGLFNPDEEYYLGPIVTFKNEDGYLEVIDGQQRLTTLMLLLRAFYSKFGKMSDNSIRKLKESIEQCIWKVDEDDERLPNELKIASDVATDNDKEEFLEILKSGETKASQRSLYARNFNFFQEKIDSYKNDYPEYFSKLPKRIIDNCILLPIEAESQDTALRIFSTLNDRGLPLSDADIFKAQFYKYFSGLNRKDEFIRKWKDLEVVCERIFHPIIGTPMDEVFTRYMYYVRAKMGIKSTTTEALRKFYEKNKYSILKREDTFQGLIDLAAFWESVNNQDEEAFSDEILRKLFVLNYAPNGMWTYFVSVFYMQNRDSNGRLEEKAFSTILDKITAFIWTYAVTHPGVNALRAPLYSEMINVVEGNTVTFDDYRFDETYVRKSIGNYIFGNGRPITRSMLAWWAYRDNNQELIPLDTILEIEHIFAKNRQDKEKSLSEASCLELLGNKALLEKRINIRASDYRFDDKKKYYNGFTSSRGEKKATQILELKKLAAQKSDFVEADIHSRNKEIIDGFVEFLKQNDLIK